MKSAISARVLVAFALGVMLTATPAAAADVLDIESLALCRESWLDWKDDAARGAQMGESLRANYVRMQGDSFFVPKASKSVAGLQVTQVFPDSIGMAVGFSVVVEARFETARGSLESKLGKPLKQCETSDGMKSCQLELAPKKTILVMAPDKASIRSTLIGCAYYYEK